MARREPRPAATNHQLLESQHGAVGGLRTITTLDGMWRLRLRIRRCNNEACPLYHLPYRPEEEGMWAPSRPRSRQRRGPSRPPGRASECPWPSCRRSH
jgi:hypothetical protein